MVRAREARVGFPFVAEEEIAFYHCQAGAEYRGYSSPSTAIFPADSGGGCQAEGEEMEEVGEKNGGEGVVEVGKGVVGFAEGAVR